MNAFHRWLMEGPVETRPAMQAGLDPGSSEMGFQVARRPGLFDSFSRWYNEHRGDWNEVMAAAQKSPSLARFITAVEQAYSANKGADPVIVFKGKTIRGAKNLASIIEFNVARQFPRHSKRRDHDNDGDFEYLTPKLDKEVRNAYMSGRYPSQQYATSPTSSRGSDGPTAEHTPSSVQGHNILPFLQSMERRLRDLEAKVGVDSGPEYFKKA